MLGAADQTSGRCSRSPTSTASLSKRLIDAEIAADPAGQGPERAVQRPGLSAFLAQQRLTDAQVRQIDRRRCSSGWCDAGRRECARFRRHGDALCLDAARIARGRSRCRAAGTVQGGPEADRRAAPAILCRQPHALHGARAAGAALRHGRSGAGRRTSRPRRRKSRLITTRTRHLRRKETRNISQVVVPDQATANAIAAARQGRSNARGAAAPAGATRAVTSLDGPNPSGLSPVAGDKAAAAPRSRRRRARSSGRSSRISAGSS